MQYLCRISLLTLSIIYYSFGFFMCKLLNNINFKLQYFKINPIKRMNMLQFTQFAKQTAQDLVLQIKQVLAQVIVSLESDQVIQQIRNDPNLYNEKISYIQELIRDQFNIQDKFAEVLQENYQIRKQYQEKIQFSKQQYLGQINNIEIQYKRFLNQKELQKEKMQSVIKKLTEQNSQFSSTLRKLQKSNQTLQGQLQNLKDKIQTEADSKNDDLNQLKREKNKLQLKVQEMKIQKKTIKQQHQKIIQDLASKCGAIQQKAQNAEAAIRQEYEQIIDKMKNDMHLIKDSWENKCNQIQESLKSQYSSKLIESEQKMHQQLQEHIKNLKLGKNVVLKQNNQILSKRRQILQKQYNQQTQMMEKQLSHIHQKLEQAQMLLSNVSQEKLSKDKEINEQKKMYQFKLQTLSREKQKLAKQIQTSRNTEAMLLKQVRKQKQFSESDQKELQKIKDQFNIYKKKQVSLQAELQQNLQANQKYSQKINVISRDNSILNDKIRLQSQDIQEKQSQIIYLQTFIDNLKKQYSETEGFNRKYQHKLQQYALVVREYQDQRRTMIKKIDKLYISTRKLAKELLLVKEQIKCIAGIAKTKTASQLNLISEFLMRAKENYQNKYRQKVNNLLQEMQDQQFKNKELVDSLFHDKENLIKQIKQLEFVIDRNSQQHVRNRQKVVNLQVQKSRLIMTDQIARQRQQRRSLQQRLHNKQKQYDYLLNRVQKQVNKQITAYISKWGNRIKQLEDDLTFKEKYLKQTINQLKLLAKEHEELIQQSQSQGRQLQKNSMKYENLRQERDKTVEELMRRLEKETKHKINLQKQLKQIRAQLMKTQSSLPNNNQYINYSFTDRQNNADQFNFNYNATTHHKSRTNLKKESPIKMTNANKNRQKQLSEIRQMIAKTYKVVEQGPERDSPLRGKHLF